MARITKKLCVAVGSWTEPNTDKVRTEYRDIGLMIEFEDGQGNKWHEIKLHADILQPSLAVLVRQQMDRGTSNARVKLFDVARKVKDKSLQDEPGPPEGGDGGAEDDDIPF
jgi:hypothetical protein